MTDADALELSKRHVSDMADGLDVSEKTIEHAERQALRVDREYAINRSPKTIAAASIYMHALFNNEKVTQDELERRTGVGAVTISRCYREIADAEGYPVQTYDRDSGVVNDVDHARGFFDRVLPWR